MTTTHASPEAQRPTLIVVLGMHRSGTSVTTRAMETLGARFGDNLMPAAEGNNPKGFFEDMDVASLNIELMRAAGVEWNALPEPVLDAIDPAELQVFRERALALLREKCQSGIFALKDPRIARLLPFWQPVFDQLGARLLYVVAFRHPVSVARSLEARDSLPLSKSFLLWLAHVVPALRHTEQRTRALVNYDAMMEAPLRELERLSAQLDLPLDAEKGEVFARDFLEQGLRHTHFSGAQAAGHDEVPVVLSSLFSALETYAATPTQSHESALNAALTSVEAFLSESAPLMAYDWHLEQTLLQTRTHFAKVEQEAGAHSAALERALAGADACIESLKQAVAQANACIEALQQERRAAQSRNEAFERQVREQAESRCELQSRFDALEATARDQQHEIERLTSMLNEILTSSSWRVTAPLRAVRKHFAH